MRLAAIVFTLGVALATPVPAIAGVTIFGDDQLREVCGPSPATREGALAQGMCIGYVRGVFDKMFADSAVAHMANPALPDPTKCLPKYVSNEIIGTIVKDWLKANNSKPIFAVTAIQSALYSAFPGCLHTSPNLASN